MANVQSKSMAERQKTRNKDTKICVKAAGVGEIRFYTPISISIFHWGKMSGNIKINIDLASRIVTQNQFQKSWCCISVLIQYQKSSKWCVKTQYQNQEMDFVFSRSKQISRLALISANINIKTKIMANILEFFKILDIFHLLWHHCYLKNNNFLTGIKT